MKNVFLENRAVNRNRPYLLVGKPLNPEAELNT